MFHQKFDLKDALDQNITTSFKQFRAKKKTKNFNHTCRKQNDIPLNVNILRNEIVSKTRLVKVWLPAEDNKVISLHYR